MTRWTPCIALIAICFVAQQALAQGGYAVTTADCTHSINLPPSPIPIDDVVRVGYYQHVWEQDQPGGTGGYWNVAPPYSLGGFPQYNAMPFDTNPQPATFNLFGADMLASGNDHYGPWEYSYSWCRPGYSATSPACVSTISPVRTANILVPQHGTYDDPQMPLWPPFPPHDIGWASMINSPTGTCAAGSAFHIEPRVPGSGFFSASLSEHTRYHVGYDPFLPDLTHAFAWSQMFIKRSVRPQFAPPSISVSWGASFALVLGQPGPAYLPYVPPSAYSTITRVYDPISFVVTDVSTGATRTGELFHLVADVSLGGSCNLGNGNCTLDTQRGGLRVRMEHPFITPRGTLDIEIEGGVVVTSRATGHFASMALPSVGSVGPHSITFPAATFDFVFDASSAFPGDHDVDFYMGGGGPEQITAPEPTGAGCVAGVCTSGMTESECLDAGGVWQGPGTACADVPYFVETPLGGFEDIALLGVPSVAGNCDDCGEFVPLGFDFDYFGSTFNSVGISSNGYLAFNGLLDKFLNQSIPNSGTPNAMIAGYWDDLNPLAGGDVHYATLGAAPLRRFVAQWTDVPHYGTTDPLHTFQIVLHEGTNAIEYLYLDAPVVGGAISPTVGLENAAGTAGLTLDPMSFVPMGSRRFVPAPGLSCASTSSYCTAGTTTHGCSATMAAAGTPSASAGSGFVVSCTGVEGQQAGVLFYGVSGALAKPWGMGSTSLLCVKAPMQRMSTQPTGGTLNQCNGALSIDLLTYFASHPTALGTPFVAGDVCWLQAWFRDPPSPKTTNLSNGLQVTLLP